MSEIWLQIPEKIASTFMAIDVWDWYFPEGGSWKFAEIFTKDCNEITWI
jgi:hypothetical protein